MAVSIADTIRNALPNADTNKVISSVKSVVETVSNSTEAKAAFRYFQAASNIPRRANIYMVGISDDCPIETANINAFTPLLAAIGINVQTGFNVLGVRSFRVQYTGPSLPVDQLSKLPCIEYVEDDVYIHQQQNTPANSTVFAASENACLQTPAMDSERDLWGLDAIDGKINNSYGFDLTGEGVNVYVVDSGIRVGHPEFEGRAQNIFAAESVKNQVQEDCTGHGTHVAGLIGGRTVGVAKKANLFGLRIIDCARSGSVSDAVEALNFLSTNMKKPAVVNVSLGSTDGLRGDSLPRALASLARAGAAISIAAGNSQKDVCDTSLPSMTTVANTFVVGALDKPSVTDTSRGVYEPRMASFSNFGDCVQWWAPGVDIWSSSNSTLDVKNSALAYEQRQGTSQAAPLLAGILTQHLGVNPNLTPAELQSLLMRDSLALPEISQNARHIVTPRAATVNGASQYARTQSSTAPSPFAKCQASNTGVVSALSTALNTSSSVAVIILCACVGGALILGLIFFMRYRRRRARKAAAANMANIPKNSPSPFGMSHQNYNVPRHHQYAHNV